MIMRLASIWIPGVTIFMAGCSSSDDAIKFFNANIGSKIGLKLQTTENKPHDATMTEKTEDPSSTHREMNAEIIKEMFKVVLNRELRSDEELAKYMNVMDQGGHFEGIYNGLVYSTEYKSDEKGVATVNALKMYADLMAQITLDQKFDPLKIQKPDITPDVPTSTNSDLAPPQPSAEERLSQVKLNERDGITKSLYVLKRRLGEETLKTIDLKKEYKEKLATWYGRFTVFLNKKGVDFGVPQRNRADENYHYKFALESDEDRLKWECLNRIHMLMETQNQAK